MRVRWTTEATQELDGIGARIAEDNPVAAERVTAAFGAAAKRLEDFPSMGRAGRVARTRELVIGGTPYIVAYAVQGDCIYILTMQHGAQEWPQDFVSASSDRGRADDA
jgi:addiction module RelE/StbE family toxin